MFFSIKVEYHVSKPKTKFTFCFILGHKNISLFTFFPNYVTFYFSS